MGVQACICGVGGGGALVVLVVLAAISMVVEWIPVGDFYLLVLCRGVEIILFHTEEILHLFTLRNPILKTDQSLKECKQDRD